MRAAIKKISAILMALCMVMSMLPMGVLAADTITVTAVVPEDWTSAYCYVWTSEFSTYEIWPGVEMTKSGDVWTVEIPTGYDNIIINQAASGQQTVDLEMDGSQDVWVTLTTMTESKYDATISYSADGEPEPVITDYYVTGSTEVFGEWLECNDNGKMTAQGDVYVKTFYDVPADEYELKVNDGTWANSWGDPDSENGSYRLSVESDGSCVTITFDPATETVSAVVTPEGEPEPEPEPDPEPVITDCYVTGSTEVFSNWLEFNPNGRMTNQGGIYVKTLLNVPGGDYELVVNDGTWEHYWGDDSHPNGNYCFSVDGDGSAVTVKFDPATKTVSVEIVDGSHGSQPELVDGYYEIYNADQLYWFAEQVNSGNASINGRLMAYIVVNENVLTADGELNGDGSNFRVWTPIGYSSGQFEGTFDGNGKTVSGLYFNDIFRNFVGLFGYVGSGGIVQNIGLIESFLSGGSYVGGVVGRSDGCIISNCFNMGSVKGRGHVGGVVGTSDGCTVNNCYNTSTVTSSGRQIGGVVGYNDSGSVSNCYNTGTVTGTGYSWELGGVVGRSDGCTVSNCYNAGSVSGTEKVGGVVGYSEGYLAKVYKCCNIGTVSGTSTEVGGVVGFSDGTVSGCYNTGSVTSRGAVGGVVGHSDGYTVSNCYNTGSVRGCHHVGGVVGYSDGCTVSDSYNTGTVTGDDIYIGGVVGSSFEGSVSNCYNAGSVSGDNGAGGVVCCSDGCTVSDCYNAGYISGHGDAAGVVCVNRGDVNNCYNTGTVSCKNSAGGVACVNDGTISNCYNIGTVVGSDWEVGGVAGINGSGGTISNCYNIGSVRGDERVGGVVGDNNLGGVSNCYYLADCVANDNGYGTAKTAEQFASGEVCVLLQGQQEEQIWGQEIGVDPSPVLFGEKVYQITDGETVLGYSNVEGQLPELGVTVSGTVDSYITDGDVTVELIQDGEVVYTTVVNGMTVGYAMEGVATGTYILRVSKENHVTREYEVTVGEEDVTLDCKICPMGDVTGDGVVNIKDFQRLLRHVNRTAPLEGYALACGNVTNDQDCNIKDFQRLLRHVNRTSPLF